jgi:hypothetical protein
MWLERWRLAMANLHEGRCHCRRTERERLSWSPARAGFPPFGKAQHLALLLRVPFGYFFLSEPPPEDIPLPVPAWRNCRRIWTSGWTSTIGCVRTRTSRVLLGLAATLVVFMWLSHQIAVERTEAAAEATKQAQDEMIRFLDERERERREALDRVLEQLEQKG